MKINVKKQETATIELSIDDLKKYFGARLKEFDLEDYTIVGLYDTTKTEFTQGVDPHDGDYEEYFDGIKIRLQKVIKL